MNSTDTNRADAIGHYNRGVACYQDEDYAQAIGHYGKALELRPDWPEAMFNLACALKMISDLEGALKMYLKLEEMNPGDSRTLLNIGSLYLERDDGENALLWLERARQGAGDNAVLFNNLGRACILQKRFSRAREHFEQAIRLDPDLAEAWFNLAEVNAAENRPLEAVELYRSAIEKQPDMYAAHNNMGNVLRVLKRYPEAIEAFQKVVEHNPQLAEAHYNLGSAYQDNAQYAEALQHLATAIHIRPEYAHAWSNLALACKNTGDLDRARSYFDRALQIDPDLALAHWNRSFVHLLQGDWLQGWADFEWRFEIPKWRTLYPHRIRASRWDGHPIGDRTLLVHDEQGLGDTLQFVRFLAPARRRCGRLILETRPELETLLRGVAGIDDIVLRSPDHPPEVAFDRYVPLMSLAGLFQTTPECVPSPPPYLHAPAERIAHWQAHLPDGDFRVGLVWAGRPEHANDANRSCSLRQISTLFDQNRIQFICLQKGPAGRQIETFKGYQNVFHYGEQLQDFADTAGIIMNLDLVITVDTSVAHLAGALGRPVWVMIPYIPDWRWMMNGSKTPWYPSMVLFRQKSPKDWRTLIGEIRSSLLDVAAK